MKLYTTTPKHDKPISITPVEVMMGLDMYQHWIDNASTPATVKVTPDGVTIMLFVNPAEQEWSDMRENSFMLIRSQNHLIEPLMLS